MMIIMMIMNYDNNDDPSVDACPEAMHPRGPAEGAHYHYYSLLLEVVFMNDLCLEAVHPRGPADEHYP